MKVRTEGSGAPPAGVAEQEVGADHRDHPDGRVKLAVPDHVLTHAVHRGGGHDRRSHVVPRHDLVQQDSVDEASHADANGDTSAPGGVQVGLGRPFSHGLRSVRGADLRHHFDLSIA